ncbi:hypothetical protein [Mesomycoplasma hyopneumoniae]
MALVCSSWRLVIDFITKGAWTPKILWAWLIVFETGRISFEPFEDL